MMKSIPKCDHCPVKCDKPCIVQMFGATNLCRKVDPDDPKFHPDYPTILADKSCGTTVYKTTVMDGLKKLVITEVKPGEEPKEEPKQEYPSLTQQGKNFFGSMWNYAKSGFKNVSDENFNKRMAVCQTCDRFDEKKVRCRECGCFLKAKARQAAATCPLDKWDKDENGNQISVVEEPTKKEIDISNQSYYVHPCGSCNK